MTTIDKRQLVALLRSRLLDTLQSVTESQRATQSGATHEESRPEHAKDTRATEASYLARGLAKRVEALRLAVRALDSLQLQHFDQEDPVALTALVELAEAGAGGGGGGGVQTEPTALVWMVPAGGGEELGQGERAIRCVTPTSPLGRSLMGRVTGDELILDLPKGRKPVEIVSVQ